MAISKKSRTPKSPPVHAYANVWSHCTPATEEDVKTTEAAIGKNIPEPLAELFATCAGGRPERNFYLNEESHLEVGIGYLLPLRKQGLVSSLATTYGILRKNQPTFPNDLLPFAFDRGAANLLCLCVPSGEIVYWLHDDAKQPVRPVAESLTAFLSGLTESPY